MDADVDRPAWEEVVQAQDPEIPLADKIRKKIGFQFIGKKIAQPDQPCLTLCWHLGRWIGTIVSSDVAPLSYLGTIND
jgi:hypothetical protein